MDADGPTQNALDRPDRSGGALLIGAIFVIAICGLVYELIAGALDYLDPIITRRCFEPAAHPRVAADELAAIGSAVVVVGHEPSLSALGALLLGRPAFPPFRTAQCCAIEHGKPTWTARADVNQVRAYFVE